LPILKVCQNKLIWQVKEEILNRQIFLNNNRFS
jgi:hypothetical protein